MQMKWPLDNTCKTPDKPQSTGVTHLTVSQSHRQSTGNSFGQALVHPFIQSQALIHPVQREKDFGVTWNGEVMSFKLNEKIRPGEEAEDARKEVREQWEEESNANSLSFRSTRLISLNVPLL